MKTLAAAMCSMLLLSTPATADICAAVLTSNAFNIADSKTTSDYKRGALSELCKTEWSSESDFQNRAANFGTGGSYAEIFKGHAEGGTSSATNSTKAHYDALCVKQDADVIARFNSNMHVQSVDAAVNAWKTCVTTRQQAGLWSALSTQPDTSRFVIEVFFKGATPTEKLLITGYDESQGYVCKYNNDPIFNYAPRDHGGSDIFSLTCNKTASGSIYVNINTNTATEKIGPYTVPSDAVRDLKERNFILESRIRQLERTSSELQDSILAMPLKLESVRYPRSKDGPRVSDWEFITTTGELTLDDSKKFGICALSKVAGSGQCTIIQLSDGNWTINVTGQGQRCQATCSRMMSR